jgi:outer membrane autotransporter protein
MHIDTDGVMEHTNYDVDVDAAGHSDLIHAAGGFTILTYPDTYDHVVVTAAPGAYAASTTYTILTADGGVGGTFTDVADNMAFLDASLSYDVNDVYLTLTRNDIALWDVAETPNQNAVAHAVGEFAPSTLHDEIVTLSADDARSAYDSLSGEVHASVGSVLSGQTALVDDTIRSRFAVAFGSGDETPLAFGDDVKSGTNAADKAIAPKPLVSAWAQGFGQWTDADGDGNAAGVESNVGGLLAGVDGTFGNVTIGIAGGYASASTDVADRKSSANSSTGLLAAYAGTDLGPIGLRGGASYGWTQVDTSRVTTVGNITEHPKASYDGGIGNVFVEAARLVRLAGIGFEPFAGIAWTNVDLDGFTETNAPLTGLTSDGQSFDSLYSTLGLRAASNFALGNRFLFRQHAMLGWRHAFGDVTPDMTMSLAETGADFTVQGLPIASDSAVIEAGVDLALGGGASLDLSYAGNISADASAHAVKLTGAVNF